MRSFFGDLRGVITDLVAESDSYDSDSDDGAEASSATTPGSVPRQRRRRTGTTPLAETAALQRRLAGGFVPFSAGDRVETVLGAGTVVEDAAATSRSVAVALDWADDDGARCYVQRESVARERAATAAIVDDDDDDDDDSAAQRVTAVAAPLDGSGTEWLLRCHAQVCALIDRAEGGGGRGSATAALSAQMVARSPQQMEAHERALGRFVTRIETMLDSSSSSSSSSSNSGGGGARDGATAEAAMIAKISELQLQRTELLDRVEALTARGGGSGGGGAAQLSSKLRVLQQRLDASESRVRAQAGRLNDLETVGDDASAAAKAATSARVAMERAQRDAATLKQERDAAVAAMDETSDALLRVKTKLVKTGAAGARNTQEIGELRQSNREYEAALLRLRGDNAKTRDRNATLLKQLEHKTSGKLEEAEDEAAELGGQVDELVVEVDEARTTIVALRERVATLTASEHRHFQRATLAEEQLEALRKDVALQHADLDQSEEELTSLQAVLRQFRERKDVELAERSAAADARRATREAEHGRTVEEVEARAARRTAEWEREAERARTQLERTVNENARLQQRIAGVRTSTQCLPYVSQIHYSALLSFSFLLSLPRALVNTRTHPHLAVTIIYDFCSQKEFLERNINLGDN